MTESEYIDATSLCKARIVASLLRDISCQKDQHQRLVAAAQSAIAKLCRELGDSVRTTE